MKDPSQRTKVVVRHLPPSLAQSDLFSQIETRLPDRYNWFAFHPGKSSHKHQRYSRAYIDFKTSEDVFEFAEFFDRHVFVNEKGAQFKTIVEYAPSQHVPKPGAKKDAREGTIYKDPDYLEFLKLIAKPAESLPSAEIQLERKEAEQSGIAKGSPTVTPLMEFVRQKRAFESGSQGLSDVGKLSRRARAAYANNSSRSSKRNSEKKKYVKKDSSKSMSRKGRSTYNAMPRQDDQPVTLIAKEMSENETGKIFSGIDGSLPGIPMTTNSGNKKILLVKARDRDNPPNSQSLTEQQKETSSTGSSSVPTASRQNQRRDAGGRSIRSILLKNESQQSLSSSSVHRQHKIQLSNTENSKRPPQPVSARADDRFTGKDHHGSGMVSEKQEKRVRNKDRPDRVVWAPLRRSDVSHSREVTNGEGKGDMSSQRTAEAAASSSGYHPHSAENGSGRHIGRRVGGQSRKDDGSLMTSEGKSSRRGVSSSSALEKQMWIQKSSLGS